MIFIPQLILISWSVTTTVGPQVSGHCTATSDQHLYLFGGLLGSAGSKTTEDFWSFDGNQWNKINAKNRICPSRRMYAASAMLNNSFYLFGGWDPGKRASGGNFKDDIWKFDLDTESWSELYSMENTVSRHSACTVDNKIILHTFRGIYVLDDTQIKFQETIGDAPDDLSMCSVNTINNTIVVISGSNRYQEMSNDLFTLNTKTWKWTKTSLDIKPRSSAVSAVFNETSIIMFSGGTLHDDGYDGGHGLIDLDDTYLITFENDKFKSIKLLDNELSYIPEGRVASSLNKLGDSLILQGGWSPSTKETFKNTVIFSL